MSFQVIVIGGVVGCFLVSIIADGMVAKGAAVLPPDVRERVYQRALKWDMLLRVVDGFGFILLVLGMLGLAGVIKGGPDFPWRLSCVGTGFAVLCVERVLGAWVTCNAYANEVPGQPVHRQAFAAALVVSIAEIALAVGVCWWIYTHTIYNGRSSSNTSTPAQTSPGTNAGPGMERTYVNEKGALEIIGKDKAYLDVLVKYMGIRKRSEGEVTFYRKDDLTTAKDAGLPTLEEMEEALKRKPVSAQQLTEAVQPLLDQGKRDAALQQAMDLTGWEKGEAEKFLESLPGGKPGPAPTPAKTGKTPEGEALQE